jgi:hypothetical protein
MWKDFTASAPERAAVMIEFGSLALTAEAAAVGAPVLPGAAGADVALLLHALATTRTKPASRDRAGLGARNTL